jgi:RHS repeat-associated protein
VLGVTTAERQQLASLYNVGQTLWRTPIAHLSSWDPNWNIFPPDDAQTPDSVPDPQPPDPKVDKEVCPIPVASIIESQNQVLGEAVGLTGTPFSLNYRSDRVRGRKAPYTLTIPLSGASVPASLESIILQVKVAGQFYSQTFDRFTTNQTTTFTWDGKEYGREVQGARLAAVRVGYTYKGVYKQTSRFGGPGGKGIGSVTGDVARQNLTLWGPTHIVSVGGFDFRGVGLGAWSLNVHHVYDVNAKVLYLGSGDRRSTNAIAAPITTVAGGGSGGDGGPATAASLSFPRGVAVGPDGSFYIADTNNISVRKVVPDDTITTIAGPTSLGDPEGVAVGPDGSVYIADGSNNRIRRVGPDGIITTVAGNGSNASNGDGEPAIAASIGYPQAVAVGPDGSFYISASPYDTIRRVGTDGIITTIAGNGGNAHTGDGGPATAASLASPVGIAAGYDGSLYIVEAVGYIRRVGPEGIITTVAGNGGAGYSGDGGPATAASIGNPWGIAVGPDGSLYIADSAFQSSRIRRVGPDGIITTFAGNGVAGFSGDGGSATAASLFQPRGVAVGPDGSFYIADFGNSRIRAVRPALPGFTASDLYIASEDGAELYHFDSAGRHLRTLNTLTGAELYHFDYDANGRLSTVTDGDSNKTAINHDPSGVPTSIVGSFGQQTTLSVDANGYLHTISDPAGDIFTMIYASDGLLTGFTDPNNNSSSMKYDPLGRLALDTDPAGGFTTLTRTEADRSYTASLTTALNRTTLYQVETQTTGNERSVTTFDDGTQTKLLTGTDGSQNTTWADGTVVNLLQGPDPRFSMQTPLPKSSSITMGGVTSTLTTERTANLADPLNPLSLNNLTDKLTVNGRTFTSSFDPASKTFTSTTAAGRQSTTTIDGQGRVTQAQVAGLLATTLSYTNGRVASLSQGTGADQRTIIFGYDNSTGFLTTITDPLNHVLNLQSDAAGRITKVTLADGRLIAYGPDAYGNLKSLTPPGQPVHSFAYNSINRMSLYTPPTVAGTGNTIYDYDADRRIATITRADNSFIKFGYDCCLKKVTIGRGVYTYTPDPAMTGHLKSIQAPDSGLLTYSYKNGWLETTNWSGAVAGSMTEEPDANLRLGSVSVSEGQTINFTYDDDGLVTRIGNLQAGNMILTRDPQKGGLVNQISCGSAEREVFSHNDFGEFTGVSVTCNGTRLIFSEVITRDKLGRVAHKVETIASPSGGAATTTIYDYVYYPTGELHEVDQNGTPFATYQYDSNGNRTSVSHGSVITAARPCDAQDRLPGYGNAAYTYTSNGELQTMSAANGSQTLKYDELGNLLSVSLPDNTLIEYIIDGQNRRVGKKVGGALKQGFLYQDQLRPIAVLDGNNQLVYANSSNVPAYMIKTGVTYRILTDQVGSVRLVCDVATGKIAQRIDYDEFGNVLTDTNPGFQAFGFAGGLYDVDTKLVHFGARDYDPNTGRWTAKDPVLFASGDTNLYGYVLNDPVNMIDFTGLYARVCRLGNTVMINIPIHFYGPGATKQRISRWSRAIETAWTDIFGPYNVQTSVTAGPENQVQIPIGNSTAEVWGEDIGRWPSERPNATIAHEAGHLMGLLDTYDPVDRKTPLPGFENDIMSNKFRKPSAFDILLIILSHNNACPCEP